MANVLLTGSFASMLLSMSANKGHVLILIFFLITFTKLPQGKSSWSTRLP